MKNLIKSNTFDRLQCFALDRAAAAAFCMTPEQLHRAGALLGDIVFGVLKIRRDFVMASLQRHLKLDEKKAFTMARNVYRAFFTNALEMASIAFMTKDEVKSKIEARGLENLQIIRDLGRGALMISAHYGLWEYIPHWLVLNGFRMTTVVRRQSNAPVDEWFEKARSRFGAATTDSGYGLREILRTLRNGDLLGLLVDQDAGRHGYFVEFLGETASVVPGPAQIAMKSRIPLLPVAVHPQKKSPHLMEFYKPIMPEEFSKDESGYVALTASFTAIVESWVRNRPEQWFWLHRRWKTRPQPASPSKEIY